jgi:hypothetical protein
MERAFSSVTRYFCPAGQSFFGAPEIDPSPTTRLRQGIDPPLVRGFPIPSSFAAELSNRIEGRTVLFQRVTGIPHGQTNAAGFGRFDQRQPQTPPLRVRDGTTATLEMRR